MKSLEKIARHYPHQDSYRALLQFYRLKGDLGFEKLELAKRLVDLTGNVGEPLVFDVIRENLEFLDLAGDSNVDDRYGRDIIRFSERVWRTKDPLDVSTGLRLAHAYRAADRADFAASILSDLMNIIPSDDPTTLGAYVDELAGIGKVEMIIDVIHKYPQASRAPNVQRTWVRAVIETGDRTQAEGLLDDPGFIVAAIQSDQKLFGQLMLLAGRGDSTAHLAAELSVLTQQAMRQGVISPMIRARLIEIHKELTNLGSTSIVSSIVTQLGAPNTPQHRQLRNSFLHFATTGQFIS